MPAAAVDKVFEHLHAAHAALARVVGRWQPSPAGSDPAGGDPPGSGKQLQAAILCYKALAACAPAAYHANARHGVRSEAALWLTEELRGASPGFRPATQGKLQEEPERQAASFARTPGGRPQARHQRFLAPPRPEHRPVESRARSHRGRGPGPVGPLERAGPQHPNAPHSKSVHAAFNDPCEWHLNGLQNATTGGNVITKLQPVAPPPIPKLYKPPSPTRPHSRPRTAPHCGTKAPKSRETVASVQHIARPLTCSRSRTITSCPVRESIPDTKRQHADYRRAQ